MAGSNNEDYRTGYYDIDIPNNGYWNREKAYSREEYKKLFRLAYGENEYQQRFGKNSKN